MSSMKEAIFSRRSVRTFNDQKLCWRQAILTILRQIKSTNLSQLIMTKHNSHSLSAVT
jgi:hypothetical protein